MNRTPIDPPALAAFRSSIEGNVIAPGDAGYDGARKIWNAEADELPGAVARCATTADVQRSIEFARKLEVPIAVRGGGHSIPGFSTIDAGLVIDVGALRRIDVDPGAGIARAGAGLTIGEFDAATQHHGLATTFGVVSSVGIAGLTLGGGLGWLMRKHGLACDNLRSVELVTAGGDVVVSNENEHVDLLWGLKGGGGNFGVATSFDYYLHPVGPTVFGGFAAYPAESRRTVLEAYRDLTSSAPEDVTAYAALSATPDGTPVSLIAACATDPERGDEQLAPARNAAGAPLLDAFGRLAYVEQQQLLDAAYPKGQHHYWSSVFLPSLSDAVIDVLCDVFTMTKAPPLLEIVIEHMGGAIAYGDGAFAYRDAAYDVLIGANWIDPADRDRCVSWARETAAALRPFALGSYANYESEGRPDAVYGERRERLSMLKAKYDPDNIFRSNQNVQAHA